MSEAVLAALREEIPLLTQSQNSNDRFTKWATPTVNVLYSFSATIGGGSELVSEYQRLFFRGEFLF